MATVQILTATTAAEAIRKGYNAISMTNWTSATAKPLITIGSTFELGGAVYQVQTADQDTDPAAAWAGLAAGMVYLYFTAATLLFSVSSTAPTWDTDKQGYYNGAARCLGQFIKDAGANWTQKTIYKTRQYGEMTNGINIGIGVDADRNIVVASDTSINWEETNDRFYSLKSFYRPGSGLSAINVTSGTLYNILAIHLKASTNTCLVSGGGKRTTSLAHVIFSWAYRVDATNITLFYYDIATGLGGNVATTSGSGTIIFDAISIGYQI